MSKKPNPEPTLEEQLTEALAQELDENERIRAELFRLRGENAQLQGRLDDLATAFGNDGLLGVIRQIAHDQAMPPELRLRAAGLGVGYEKAKPAATVNANFSLFNFLEERRLREAKLTLEHEPAEPILGHDGGPEPAA